MKFLDSDPGNPTNTPVTHITVAPGPSTVPGAREPEAVPDLPLCEVHPGAAEQAHSFFFLPCGGHFLKDLAGTSLKPFFSGG